MPSSSFKVSRGRLGAGRGACDGTAGAPASALAATRRRPGPAVDGGQLAEEVAREDLAHLPASPGHLAAAVQHHEQRLTEQSLLDDRLARLERARRSGSRAASGARSENPVNSREAPRDCGVLAHGAARDCSGSAPPSRPGPRPRMSGAPWLIARSLPRPADAPRGGLDPARTAYALDASMRTPPVVSIHMATTSAAGCSSSSPSASWSSTARGACSCRAGGSTEEDFRGERFAAHDRRQGRPGPAEPHAAGHRVSSPSTPTSRPAPTSPRRTRSPRPRSARRTTACTTRSTR